MKRTLFLLLGLGLAACKVDMNTMLKRPRLGGSDSPPARTPEEAAAHTAQVGETATVQVDSDLCKSDPGRASEVTICEMITVEPVAGVARIAPIAPGWCAQFTADDLVDLDVRYASTEMMWMVGDSMNWMDKSMDVLKPLCVNPSDAGVQQQTAYYYQYWSNVTGGLSPDELDDLLVSFANDERYYAALRKACAEFPESEDPYQEAIRDAVGCHDSTAAWYGGTDGHDLLDAMDADPATPPELVRAYAVRNCLYDSDTITDGYLGSYAVCGVDARALDRKALDKQIASYPPIARFHARALFGRAQLVTARYEEIAQQKAAADADWQKLLYDAPAQGWKDWQALYETDRDAVATMRALEREPKAGCFEDAYRRLTDHVKAAKPKDREAARRAMGDMLGAILLSSAAMCAKVENDDVYASPFAKLSSYTRITRGPRYAAYYAVLDSLVAIRATRSDSLVDVTAIGNNFVHRGGGSDIEGYNVAINDPGGEVKKITKSEGGFLVVFKTNRWKETEWICTDTSRLKFFDGAGNAVYEQDCKSNGEHWHEGAHDDIWIPAGFEAGIKKGTYVRSTSNAGRVLPVEVWSNEKQEKLRAYLGVTL